MKLSSSTLCGCCFCCYCHCWLMMLLMVSSVVHVSPEMSTTLTTTTTTKKYTKLYNNNNYAYQSEMTEEFIQLNRKLPNRTKSRTVVATATTSSSSTPTTAMLALLPQTHEPLATRDYHYKPNNEESFIKFEHETITTIATIQTQPTTISTSQLQATATTTTTTTPEIPLATTAMISTLTPAPEQIQMNKEQQNPYKTEEIKHSENVERGEEEEESNFYTLDNSIEEEQEAEVTTSRTITTTTNYAADNSNVFVPPTILSIESTTEPFVKPMKTMKKILSNNKNNNNNVKPTTYWNDSIDLQPNKTRYQQQENNTSKSKSRSNSSYSDNSLNNHNKGSKDFVNSNNNSNNYRSSNTKQKTTNTFSLNHNNRYGTVNNNNNSNNSSSSTSTSINLVTQNHLTTKIENGAATTTTTTRVLNATAINSLPSSGTFDFHNKTSKTHNFKNHNNKNSNSNNNSDRDNYYHSIDTATSTDSDSNLSPKEMNQYIDITKTHHHNQHHRPQQQTPTASLSAATTVATTTALRIPTTYAPLHEYHDYSQMRRPVLLHRHARQAAGAAATDDELNDKCRMFVEGDPEKNELYSPDYPNDYPKNINCTRVIIAPKGQIIRLDFRNSFHIEEKEECKFDFLEIRDGQYGFSNLIGKFCGTDFPPEITSKERYLWLHFHSDESIEYSGFTAVYEFIDRNRDAPSTDLNCTIERDGFEGFVNASDVPTEIKDTVIRNKIPLDCMWRIQVQEKWKIQVKFVDFKLAKPNDCESNFLDIFPEQTVMPLRVKNFCGSAGEGITSESNILHVRFYAEQSAITSSFSILYTAFRERGSSSCAEDEYDCEDATCIAGNLKCNGRSNCKFLWDEEGCKPEDNGQSEHMIIIITVFGLILGGMVITFLVNCVRKIMHDQKIIREHIRQSKESKLDEMGRNSKGRSRDNISIVSPRQKHSQTSLQILDDVSNRYYREIEMQTKSNFKEKDPSILRHDMIVQTSLCSTDDSSTTTTEQQQQQQQQQTPSAGVGSSACDMGCQTRESLFATASLMRQKSKTPSLVGSQRTIEGVPPPPRFSTFGYDAAQIAPPPPPTVSTLSRRNMHLPQESLEMEQLPQQQGTHTMMMMPHQQHHQHPQQQQQQHPQQQQQQHQHLHHRPSQEICHHHHQHQQHLQQQQQQKQTLPRHHQQQHQQQQQQLPQHHQHMQQHQQQHHQHHTSSTTIPPNVTKLPAQPPGTAVVTAISTGSSGRQREQQGTGSITAGKNKQTKVDESKVFIDIRNSAPDVIIMTSH